MDQVHKTPLTWYAILASIFFLLAWGLHYFSDRKLSDDFSIHQDTQAAIWQKETFLENLLQHLTTTVQKEVSFSSCHEVVPEKLWEKNGMTIFVYQNDSLIYWSDNNVPPLPVEYALKLDKSFLHHGNGWFQVLISKGENLLVIGLILVKHDYPYQNEYLVNNYQDDLEIDSHTRIDTVPGRINITSKNGTFLFSLDIAAKSDPNRDLDILIFIAFTVSFVLVLLLLFYAYHLFDFFRQRPLILFLAFLFDALLLRFLMLYLKIPGFLYHTELFSPFYFATSFISPSLGDLVINSFLWLTLAWLFYRNIDPPLSQRSVWRRYLTGITLVIASAGLFAWLMLTVKKVILDSSFELNLNNIFNINVFSALAFLALIVYFVAFFMVASKLACTLCKSGMSKIEYVIFSLLGSIWLVPLFLSNSTGLLSIVFPSLFLLFLLSFLFFAEKKGGYQNITGVLFFIVLFSLIGTFLFDYYQNIREKDKRKILAAELSTKRDPMMEFEFGKLYPSILKDTTLKTLLLAKDTSQNGDMIISEYLEEKYFEGVLDNYEHQVTICNDRQILEIQPEGYLVNCFDYFNGILLGSWADTVANGLYFFKNRSENNNYIAIFEFPDATGDRSSIRIFVELFYKYFKETGLGYPDLLIDRKVKMISGLENYSYSRYFEGSLVYKYGDFSYHLLLEPFFSVDSLAYFMDREGFNHYVTKQDDDNILIISKKIPTWLDLVAPFSYFFIFFSLFILIFLIVIMLPSKFRNLEFNFSNQLQLSIILIIVISFFILGVITRSRIIRLNDEKNRDVLSEKTFSVLTELEHKIGDVEYIPKDMQGYLRDLLYKFSLIFFSDINLFDPQGNLIASSRPQIFEEDLLSMKMNTGAFQKLALDMNLLWIQNEKIGLQEYLSAYTPLRNNNDEIIAYINLPYFAKQTEIRKEISNFLVAYINVYVLLIVLAIMATIIVSRLVTRPLQLIRDKLGRVRLGTANEKIEWTRKDEIGSLIEEYNRMVDELARSAELLAASERESAWREMAKQVAHEIKNPLTPMKLSIQYLKKAWDEKAPDWDKRLDRFTRTIVEQIDSLSQIASEFSDFAKMPVASSEKIDLTAVIRDAVNLYQDVGNIKFSEDFQNRPYYIMADKRQLLRVFNNLIQNAVQAIGTKDDGRIGIRIHFNDGYHQVEISDNGSGISEEQAARIFSPSFTTKSSGTGLGLAMVKNIVTSIGGTVSFTSKEGQGTTFLLKLPEYREN